MKNKVLTPIILLVLILIGRCVGPFQNEASIDMRPNIIFVMSDDHTSQALGVYGSRLASLNPTPTLDRLANQGMVFTNCFVTNSICTPSRTVP